MNPYLEQPDAWHSFHDQFCAVIQAALVPQVRPDYIVKLDENIYVHELSAEERRLAGRGDITVATGRSSWSEAGGVAMTAPVRGLVLPSIDIERENFIEIRERETRRLITVIELLSPTNKRPGSDRDQFLTKRYQLLASTAHYVEIDLLRGGPRLPIEGLPECDSYVMVSRVDDRPNVGLWPQSLADRLPQVPIPLSTGHEDARLDLQSLLHQAYDAAGYEDYIYLGHPEPPLSIEQAEFARRVGAGAGIPMAGTVD
jgi:hypothetical protein